MKQSLFVDVSIYCVVILVRVHDFFRRSPVCERSRVAAKSMHIWRCWNIYNTVKTLELHFRAVTVKPLHEDPVSEVTHVVYIYAHTFVHVIIKTEPRHLHLHYLPVNDLIILSHNCTSDRWALSSWLNNKLLLCFRNNSECCCEVYRLKSANKLHPAYDVTMLRFVPKLF